MAGQLQALFRCANVHARMSVTRSKHAVHCGARSSSAAAAQPVRPYDDIPKSSTFADLNANSAYKVGQKLLQSVMKHGTLFRETIQMGTAEELVVCDPSDLKIIFQAEGKWPIRPEGGAWFKEAQEPNEPLGVGQSTGEPWYRQRQPVAKSMTAKRVTELTGNVNATTDDLVKSIYKLRDPETKVVSDVTRLLVRWSFDDLYYLTLGKRLNQLPPILSEEFVDEITTFELLEEIHSLYFLSDRTKMLPIQKGWERMHKRLLPYVEQLVQENEEREKTTDELLPQHNYLKNLNDGTLSMQEIVMSTLDVLLAGIRNVSLNLAWCLYLLAREPAVQEKLHKELRGVIGVEEPTITQSHISNMPYLKGCYNEALRLYGSAWSFQRLLTKDVVLSGYNVPKHTSIYIPLTVIGRLPQFFPEPESFMPERWSKENSKKPPSFAFLPFGFGPRICPGRHIGQLETYIALVKIMRKFRVEYLEDTPMDDLQVFAETVPARQLNLAFKDL